jgi:competence protein ComFC
MRCLVCENFSFRIICKKCQDNLLNINISKRVINNIDVISFFNYHEIENLLFTKKEIFGNEIFKILAKKSFKEFSKNFQIEDKIFSIAIDDNVSKKEFSHTAILNKNLKSKYIKPLYNKLIARNEVSYAKKSLEFRQNNPRNFVYTGPKNCEIILCDDVVTTGLTIQESIKILNQNNVKVLFVLTLCNAQTK